MAKKKKASPGKNMILKTAVTAGAAAQRSGKGGISGGGLGGQQAGGIKGGGKRKTHIATK
jgi:hypothetical protein